jgi:DNA-binding NarL/FixJ family response regulator
MNRIRVLLADDHGILRAGLKLLLAAQPDMTVIGETDGGQSMIALAECLRPDVIVMDISMPGMNGLAATQQLSTLIPDTAVLTLTRHSEDGYVQPLLAAGAKGYVLKQSAADELLRAIRAVAAGRVYLDPAVTEQALLVAPAKETTRSGRKSVLSRREEAVLRLIARGLLNREVAAQLNISIKTAEAHRANALAKLGMASRVDIIKYALLHGWLSDN